MVTTIWTEDFSGTPGTYMEDLGFTVSGDSGRAYISDDHQLTIKPGRVNLFTNSTSFTTTTSPWRAFSYPGTGGSAASQGARSTMVMPDGGTNGYQFTFAGGTGAWSGINQLMSLTRGVSYTISAWVCTPPGAGTTTVRPYIFDYNNNLTVTAPNITITETLTRISATITLSGTGVTGSPSTVGFGNGTTNDAATVIWWGPQLEISPRVTSYRPLGASTTNRNVWSKDTGVSDHSLECDVTASSEIIAQLALRVNPAQNSFISIRHRENYVWITNHTQSIVRMIPYTRAYPFRLRAEVTGQVVRLFAGDAGEEFPMEVIGEAAGYPSPVTVNLQSTYAGFGYLPTSTVTAYTTSTNYAAMSSMAYIQVTESRSSTVADPAPATVLPPSDGYSVPRWVEDFNSNSGILTNRSFQRVGYTGIAYATNNRLTINLGSNQMPQSNSMAAVAVVPSATSNSWQFLNGASTLGYDQNINFLDPNSRGTIIHFDNTNSNISQVRMSRLSVPTFGSGSYGYAIFSVWLAAKEGTTSCRIGMNARFSGGALLSGDIELTTTPQRVSVRVYEIATDGAPGNWCYIANNVGKTSTDVVAWGAQLEFFGTANMPSVTPTAFSARGTVNITPGLWVKPVETNRQYIECDVLVNPNANNRFTFGAVRVVDSLRFVGVSIEGTNVYAYVPNGIKQLLGTVPAPPYRFRVEISDNTVSAYTGPVSVRLPTGFIGSYEFTSVPYEGYNESILTGFGIWPTVESPTLVVGQADNYESGDLEGRRRFYVTPETAYSDTRSETILPVDLTWVEDFDADVGTPLVDLGFTFETTELDGDPLKAVVGTSHRLTLESSTLDPAIWVKDTLSHNHFVRATIYAYPFKEYEAPIIIRAAGPDKWIGIWFEDNYLVFGMVYGGNVTIYTRLNKGELRLPFTLRVQALGHYAYAYYVNGVNDRVRNPIGREMGYYINPLLTPELATAARSGIGRMNDTEAANIADRYRAGLAYPEAVVIREGETRRARSITRADKFAIDGRVLIDVNPAYYYTYGRRITKDDITFNQLVTPEPAFSDTYGVLGETSPEAVSLTTADVGLATVDIIIVSPAVSETIGESWHEPSTVEEGYAGVSNSSWDAVSTWIHQIIWNQNEITGLERPPISRSAFSNTRAGRAPINGRSFAYGQESYSITRADRALITKFVFGVETYSYTFGDAGVAISQNTIYNPWLFT